MLYHCIVILNIMDCLGSNWIFYTCFFLGAVLSPIPFAGKFLNVFNTMIHESGHAIMALITGGGVMNIKLSADTSGAAQTKSKYWIGKVLTSFAGYPVASLTAWLFFWLIQQQKVTYVLFVIISLLLINLILWVRNTFGMIWLISIGALTILVYLYGNTQFKHSFVTFCASILLFQSIYSTLILLVLAFKNPSKAGDAKNLSTFTYIPALIWALLFFCFSLYVSYRVLFLLPCINLILS